MRKFSKQSFPNFEENLGVDQNSCCEFNTFFINFLSIGRKHLVPAAQFKQQIVLICSCYPGILGREQWHTKRVNR